MRGDDHFCVDDVEEAGTEEECGGDGDDAA
jgi:hypothetical protein